MKREEFEARQKAERERHTLKVSSCITRALTFFDNDYT
jgi:hypothetical protein